MSASMIGGPLLVLVGSACTGTYAATIRSFQKHFKTVEVAALTAVWPGLLGLIPAGIVLQDFAADLSQFSIWGTFFWLGVIAGLIAYFLWSYSISIIRSQCRLVLPLVLATLPIRQELQGCG